MRAFYGLKDGRITVNFSGWEQNRVVLEAPSLFFEGAKRQEKDFPYQCLSKKTLKSRRCSSAIAQRGLSTA
jgi:hypothetical protein